MSVRRSCSCLAIAIAVPIASGACTTFKGEGDPVDGGSESAADSATVTDSGAVVDADAGPDCRASCSGPCVVDSFDSRDGWTTRQDSGNVVQVIGGYFRSQVTSTGGAYLERAFTLPKERSPIHISFEILVEMALANGSSMAKIVDNVGNEVTIEMHDGKLATCARPVTNAPSNPCSDTAERLDVGDRRRITFDAQLPSLSESGRIDLRVGCGQPATIVLPPTTILNTGVVCTFHLGVESRGGLRYDEADLLLPK